MKFNDVEVTDRCLGELQSIQEDGNCMIDVYLETIDDVEGLVLAEDYNFNDLSDTKKVTIMRRLRYLRTTLNNFKA